MPRVFFKRDFDFRHNPRATTSYRANTEYLVSQACAKKAVADGAGELTEKKPQRSEARHDSCG